MEKQKIIAISGSPRKNGNTETLLDWTIESAVATGADVKKYNVCSIRFSPCKECGACSKTGECIQDDDLRAILPEFMAADKVIIATPVFFMNMPAQLKAFIDRFQCLWAKKVQLGQPLRGDSKRHTGYLIAAGGTKGQSLFNGLNQTIKCFYQIMDIEFDEASSLYYWRIDENGAIARRDGAREEAAKLGEIIAATDML